MRSEKPQGVNLRERWVAALRSGKYEQGKGGLRRGDNYCCLGVLCDLDSGAAWTRSGVGVGAGAWCYDGEAILPSDTVIGRVGLSLYAAKEFAEANDNGATFSEIADVLESPDANAIDDLNERVFDRNEDAS